jgi:hypothetical protein
MEIDDLGPWTLFAASAGGRYSSSLVLLVDAVLLAHSFIVNFHNDKIK